MGVARIGWVAVVLIFVAALPLSARPARTIHSAELYPGIHAFVDIDQQIEVRARPKTGDSWSRIALRLTGDGLKWKSLRDLNGMSDRLMADRDIIVPFAMLSPRMKRRSIEALFPNDQPVSNGWIHGVALPGAVEGETLWKIAEWFTGRGENYTSIRAANARQPLSTHAGDQIFIPMSLLDPAFRGGARVAAITTQRAGTVMKSPDAAGYSSTDSQSGDTSITWSSAAGARKSEGVAVLAEDDPVESNDASPVSLAASSSTAAEITVPSGPVSLDFDLKAREPFAIYRLQKGEALYSSVAIRFTGRVYARDVYEVVDRIVAFNGIEDVSRLPVGFPVRIPLALLTAENRPMGDPLRREADQTRREMAKIERPARTRNLKGVQIILDAGHGGRDVGTSHGDIWESDYVYDVMCRVKREMEKKTEAKVWVTTRSASGGYDIPSTDKLKRRTDHTVLTTPSYPLDNPVIGVHLRWYLANSIFRKTLSRSLDAEKVVFVSIHADSLHPSLRGAMAYVPGSRFASGTYAKKGSVYLARAEVRENPSVTQTEDDALRAERLSTDLATSIIRAFDRNQLEVHPFAPIRTNVVRNGKEWVPAVIRYNTVPTRTLLEICNLGNVKDRALIKTARYRQKVAETIYAGLVDYFASQTSAPSFPLAVKAAAR